METGHQRRPFLGVTGPQIFSGALASVTAAVVASYFGIAGTLIGAAITSIVATVGGALYHQSIERAHARITIRRNPQTGEMEKTVVTTAAPRPRRQLPWGPIAAAITIVFALSLGVVTVMEVAARKPIASLFGRAGSDRGQTSLSVAVREVGDSDPNADPHAEAPPVPGIEDSPTTAPPTALTPAAIPKGEPGAAPTGAITPSVPVLPTMPTKAPTNTPSLAPTAAPAVPGRPAGTAVAP